MNEPASILDIRSISKTYPGQLALDNAHLQIRPGEIHALIGQNGSGKSTLIKLIAGYIKADHGAKVFLIINKLISGNFRHNNEHKSELFTKILA